MSQHDDWIQLEPSVPGAVDVVMPVRNGAATIEFALASVLNQSVPPQRIIVVDDGSGDQTVNCVERLGIPQVDIVTIPAGGVSLARNTGIRKSRAEFIAFLDADDAWHPDKIRQQLHVFESNPNVAAVYCGHALVELPNTIVDIRLPSLRGRIFNDLLAGRRAGCSSTMVVKRDALLDVQGFDESLNYGEDRDLWLRLAHEYQFDFADEILAFVIRHPMSATRRPRSHAGWATMVSQGIVFYEKWSSKYHVPLRSVRRWRRSLIGRAIQHRLGWQWMLTVRAELHELAPNLHRRVWPNHAVIVAWIGFVVATRLIRHLVPAWSAFTHAPQLRAASKEFARLQSSVSTFEK